MNETFKIGLTGGIASGKTTVCDLFKELSVEIIDADVISHELSKKGGAAFEEIIEAFEDEIIGDLSAFLAKVNCIFLTLPPGIRKNPKRNFVAVIHQLIPHIQNSKVQQVVFISSISVFGPRQGLVTPRTTPNL